MKLKLLLIIAGTAVVGSSITIVIIQSRDHATERRQAAESQNRVATTMSNYTHTFKLNTNPPLWPEAQKK
jgi:hypothetical protein